MFSLLFSYINNLKKPYLQSKLNLWEYRDVNNLAKISHILEFIITTSTTFHTKFIRTSGWDLQQIVTALVLLYYICLTIVLLVS